MSYRVLLLTNHQGHSSENSLYALARSMAKSPKSQHVDVASAALSQNQAFFEDLNADTLWVSRVGEIFEFTPEGYHLSQNLKPIDPHDYDLIWLRMPPPLSSSFLDFLTENFQKQIIINKPSSIWKTGSKSFLLNFPKHIAPSKLCTSKEDIISFAKQFPIVLKPLRDYGGKGIVKIEKATAQWDKKTSSLEEFLATLDEDQIEYLAVKFLKNVSKGDKRIIVVNGQIMGASLRLPAQGSWLCNVAMGGKAVATEIENEERNIIKDIDPILSNMGIVMYGIDTLVNDKGKRILSEINTTSIGGLPQIAKRKNLPLVEQAIELIWEYYEKNKFK